MASFDSLPGDLHREIFSYLPHSSSRLNKQLKDIGDDEFSRKKRFNKDLQRLVSSSVDASSLLGLSSTPSIKFSNNIEVVNSLVRKFIIAGCSRYLMILLSFLDITRQEKQDLFSRIVDCCLERGSVELLMNVLVRKTLEFDGGSNPVMKMDFENLTLDEVCVNIFCETVVLKQIDTTELMEKLEERANEETDIGIKNSKYRVLLHLTLCNKHFKINDKTAREMSDIHDIIQEHLFYTPYPHRFVNLSIKKLFRYVVKNNLPRRNLFEPVYSWDEMPGYVFERTYKGVDSYVRYIISNNMQDLVFSSDTFSVKCSNPNSIYVHLLEYHTELFISMLYRATRVHTRDATSDEALDIKQRVLGTKKMLDEIDYSIASKKVKQLLIEYASCNVASERDVLKSEIKSLRSYYDD